MAGDSATLYCEFIRSDWRKLCDLEPSNCQVEAFRANLRHSLVGLFVNMLGKIVKFRRTTAKLFGFEPCQAGEPVA